MFRNNSVRTTFTREHSRGFSIPELIVAVAVFSVAILIITSALLGVIDASRKAQTVRATIDNVGAGIDSMSRMMRIGTRYHCGCLDGSLNLVDCGTGDPATLEDNLDCPGGGGDFLSFEKAGGDPDTIDDQIVFRRGVWPDGKGRLERSDDGGKTYVVLTSGNVNVTELKFVVIGTQPDNSQPSVQIILKTDASAGSESSTQLAVQTSVTQRTPNFSEGSIFGFSGTSIVSGKENTLEGNCTDGVDNDNDGQTDCADWANAPDEPSSIICAYSAECKTEICNDGYDNDGNGVADCEDVKCQYSASDRAFCKETSCTDGVDSNDHCAGADINIGGVIKHGTGVACGVDEDCRSGQCNGGVCSGCGWDSSQPLRNGCGTCEDDYVWCSDKFWDTPCCPKKEICDNGIDDNGNGYIDCQDNIDCQGSPVCYEGKSPNQSQCKDTKDNDKDGKVDCADVQFCCSSGFCNSGTCATYQKGKTCSSNSQCGGGQCVAGKCNGIVGEG